MLTREDMHGILSAVQELKREIDALCLEARATQRAVATLGSLVPCDRPASFVTASQYHSTPDIVIRQGIQG